MNRVRRSFSLLTLPVCIWTQASTLQDMPKDMPQPVLEGVVLDSEDQPVEGALVVTSPVNPTPGDLPLTTRTNREGQFHLAKDPEGDG